MQTNLWHFIFQNIPLYLLKSEPKGSLHSYLVMSLTTNGYNLTFKNGLRWCQIPWRGTVIVIWCPYISAGHKLKICLCALQFNACQRTFCKPKLRFAGLFFMDIFQIAKMSKKVANAVRWAGPMALWEKPK